MAYVYTLANAKGGCGKSTVAFNLAVSFARKGYRTLAIDLDQQRNLSGALGVDLNKLKLTTHRLLIDEQADISSFLIEPRPRLKLLPNTIDTSRRENGAPDLWLTQTTCRGLQVTSRYCRFKITQVKARQAMSDLCSAA